MIHAPLGPRTTDLSSDSLLDQNCSEPCTVWCQFNLMLGLFAGEHIAVWCWNCSFKLSCSNDPNHRLFQIRSRFCCRRFLPDFFTSLTFPLMLYYLWEKFCTLWLKKQVASQYQEILVTWITWFSWKNNFPRRWKWRSWQNGRDVYNNSITESTIRCYLYF